MKTCELFWKDLTPDAQARVLDALGLAPGDHNWDVFPLATLSVEDA